ncbi:hypothetical protein Lal_00039687 [Lupinus albus]|nr:hypothetical protein Lal_00039687 [Lupinus albus]
MNTHKHQRNESTDLTGNCSTPVVSNYLLGFHDPCYAPELSLIRLARFEGRGITPTAYTNLSWMSESGFLYPKYFKNQGVQVFVELYGKMYPSLIREFYSNFQYENGVYQTMVKDRFIILDKDLMVDVGGFARFGRPYGTFEKKWLNIFTHVNAYKSML